MESIKSFGLEMAASCSLEIVEVMSMDFNLIKGYLSLKMTKLINSSIKYPFDHKLYIN